MAEKKSVSAKQVVPQGPWRPQTQSAAIVAMVLVVALIIGALYLAQATTTVSTGQQLLQLESTRDYLQRTNEDIDAQIANKRNISTLRGRAQALGFVPVDPDRLQYIVVPGYSPDRATATPEVAAKSDFTYDETFNGWAQQQWNILVKQFEAWTGRDSATPTPFP